MVRYYFHLEDGNGFTRDEEGRELAGLDAARREAVTGVRSMLSSDLLAGRLDLRGRIVVTREEGDPLFSIDYAEVVHLVRD